MPLLKRSTRKSTALYETLFEALSQRFGADLPGVDYEVTAEVSDRELAMALSAVGAQALGVTLALPPVQGKDKAERKRLHRAAGSNLDRSVDAAQFLGHAVVNYTVLYDDISTQLSEHLDRETSGPTAIQFRSQAVLREHVPLRKAETRVLEEAASSFAEVTELPGESDFEMAFGWRASEYQLTAGCHAISMILAEDYADSATGRDNSGYSNVVGNVKAGRYFRAAEDWAFEIWRTIGFE